MLPVNHTESQEKFPALIVIHDIDWTPYKMAHITKLETDGPKNGFVTIFALAE